MVQRISNPFQWEGIEVETRLIADQEAAKELLIVSVVRKGAPQAFYRVKENGETVDFEEWLPAVDYYNCIEV